MVDTSKETDRGTKTFKKLLKVTLGIMSAYSVASTLLPLVYRDYDWTEDVLFVYCRVVCWLSAPALALIATCTLVSGLTMSIKARSARFAFYTLALLSLQIAFAWIQVIQISRGLFQR